MMEDDVARRVAGAVAHVEGEVADVRGVAIVQPSRRLEGPTGDAVLHPVLFEPFDPEAVLLMRTLDWHAEFVGEDASAAAMIDMAVGEQDLFDCDPGLLSRRFQPREISARIDERTAHRCRAPDERAILLQRRDRNDRRPKRRVAHFQGSAGRGWSVAI